MERPKSDITKKGSWQCEMAWNILNEKIEVI